MPGAPNRPPETDAPKPAPVAAPDLAARRAVRRLAPMRVALRQDLWKNAPSKELLSPLEKAEAAFSASNFVDTESALDQLAVRLAEPRWPTLPTPFRELRVAIPAPTPPQWDPDFALAPAEKEAKKIRRFAELQVALAESTLAWGRAHGASLDDLAPHIEVAKAALAANGPADAVLVAIDPVWDAVRSRIAMPTAAAARPSPPPVAEPSAEEA
jgi:hypothetical protein